MVKESSVNSVIERVRQTCQRFGDNVAVTGVGETLTFDELWERSLRLARELVHEGVQPEDRVGLWANQSSDLLIGMIGIMAAGAAYVPLDPSHPRIRLEFIVDDAGMLFIVAPNRLGNAASELGVPVILVTPNLTNDQSAISLPEINEHNAAYVIYTSGSTGRPKGVVIEHHSIVDLLKWMEPDLEVQPETRFMGTASPAFDASIPNFLLPLVTGGTFVALSTETTRDPYLLAEAIAHYRPHLLQASPTMLRMLTESEWTGCETLIIMTGGERTAAAVIRYIVPRVRAVFNYYGPTETTVQVSRAILGPDDTDSPVGTPPDFVKFLLLDSNGQPTPIGEVGELFIAGPALARGYLNDPVLTDERFTLLNEDVKPFERVYRTGDLAKLRADGSYVILGRIDDQIKLRGYRIEPSEIEQRLMQYPHVVDAIVMALAPRESDEPRLVAFAKSDVEIEVRDVRSFMRETLPEYMIPAVFVKVNEFPLAPTGKVDKKRLALSAPASANEPPSSTNVSKTDHPTSELEASVLGLFASVLDVSEETIGLDDDFFDLGGTSLRCMRLFMLIEERHKVALPISTLVTASTVRLLSAVIDDQLNLGRSQPTVGDTSADEWEWVLCILWSETLKVSEVTRWDNFFDLGGSTDDALRMIKELKTLNGTEVSLPELLKAPTIAEFAALSQGRSTRSSLVPLTTTGSNTPFFCVAGPGGLALGFLPLARLLGPEQPFYGLQAHGIEQRGLPDFTLGQAAARYAKAIREVQPHGPYLIGGHSYGGVIALKVAQRLKAQGEDVALLAIFDTILPSRMSGLDETTADIAVAERRPWWYKFKPPAKISKMIRLPLVGLVRQPGILQFEMFSLHGAIQVWYGRRLEPWSGLTMVYVSEGEKSADIEASWECLLTGPWSCVSVPGGHWGLLQRPYVDILATHLHDEMALALGARTTDPGQMKESTIPNGKRSVKLSSR
jgi:amino acid adenylation domain-containing protein